MYLQKNTCVMRLKNRDKKWDAHYRFFKKIFLTLSISLRKSLFEKVFQNNAPVRRMDGPSVGPCVTCTGLKAVWICFKTLATGAFQVNSFGSYDGTLVNVRGFFPSQLGLFSVERTRRKADMNMFPSDSTHFSNTLCPSTSLQISFRISEQSCRQ